MANIIADLTARIEDYRATNAKPCKSYKTEAAAEKATAEAAATAAQHLGSKEPARYVVFFNEAWGRWVGALDMTELLRRPGVGGFIGIGSRLGFFGY